MFYAVKRRCEAPIHHAFDSLHKALWIEVRSKNEGAIAFYKKLGFSIKGRYKNYYDGDDALAMTCGKERPGNVSPVF